MLEDDMASSTHTNVDTNNQGGDGSNTSAADTEIMSDSGSFCLEGNGEENKPSCDVTQYMSIPMHRGRKARVDKAQADRRKGEERNGNNAKESDKHRPSADSTDYGRRSQAASSNIHRSDPQLEDDMASSTHTNVDTNNQEGDGSNASAADPQIMSEDDMRSSTHTNMDDNNQEGDGSNARAADPQIRSPSLSGSKSLQKWKSAVNSGFKSVRKNVKKLLPPFGSKNMVKKSQSDYQFPKGASLKQPRRVESDSDLSGAKNTKQLEELGAYSMPMQPIDAHLGLKQQQICKEEDVAHSLGYPQVTTACVQPDEEYGSVDETAAVPEETDALPIAPDDINTPYKGDYMVTSEIAEAESLKDKVELPPLNTKTDIARRPRTDINTDPLPTAADNFSKEPDSNDAWTSAERFDSHQQTYSHLQSADISFQDLPPDYDQFIGDLEKTLKDFENLRCPIYCPAPDDYHKLLLQDPEITEAMDAIKTLGIKYPLYEIIPTDHLKPIRMKSGKTSLFPNYTSTLYSSIPQMPCRVSRTMLKDTHDSHIATVGVFVEEAPSNKLELVLGVTAAHAILDDEEMDDISFAETPDSTKTQTLKLMRDKVAGRIQYDEDLMINLPDNQPAPVRDRVYVASTKFISISGCAEQGLHSHQKFLFDIALLPVDPKMLHASLDKDRDKRNVALASIRQRRNLGDEGTPQPDRKIDGYINIRDEDDIDRLRVRNVSIECEGSTGKLAIHPKSFEGPHRKWKLAPHFAFTLDDKDLLGGHSGSPVLVYNRRERVYHVIGIFSGKFRGTSKWSHKALYQATPYGPALKQLQFLYGSKLGGVKPVVGDAGGISVEDSLPSLAQ